MIMAAQIVSLGTQILRSSGLNTRISFCGPGVAEEEPSWGVIYPSEEAP